MLSMGDAYASPQHSRVPINAYTLSMMKLMEVVVYKILACYEYLNFYSQKFIPMEMHRFEPNFTAYFCIFL